MAAGTVELSSTLPSVTFSEGWDESSGEEELVSDDDSTLPLPVVEDRELGRVVDSEVDSFELDNFPSLNVASVVESREETVAPGSCEAVEFALDSDARGEELGELSTGGISLLLCSTVSSCCTASVDTSNVSSVVGLILGL